MRIQYDEGQRICEESFAKSLDSGFWGFVEHIKQLPALESFAMWWNWYGLRKFRAFGLITGKLLSLGRKESWPDPNPRKSFRTLRQLLSKLVDKTFSTMSSSNASHLQAAIKTRIAITWRTPLQVDDDVKANWPKLLSAPAVKLLKIPI